MCLQNSLSPLPQSLPQSQCRNPWMNEWMLRWDEISLHSNWSWTHWRLAPVVLCTLHSHWRRSLGQWLQSWLCYVLAESNKHFYFLSQWYQLSLHRLFLHLICWNIIHLIWGFPQHSLSGFSRTTLTFDLYLVLLQQTRWCPRWLLQLLVIDLSHSSLREPISYSATLTWWTFLSVTRAS